MLFKVVSGWEAGPFPRIMQITMHWRYLIHFWVDTLAQDWSKIFEKTRDIPTAYTPP